MYFLYLLISTFFELFQAYQMLKYPVNLCYNQFASLNIALERRASIQINVLCSGGFIAKKNHTMTPLGDILPQCGLLTATYNNKPL